MISSNNRKQENCQEMVWLWKQERRGMNGSRSCDVGSICALVAPSPIRLFPSRQDQTACLPITPDWLGIDWRVTWEPDLLPAGVKSDRQEDRVCTSMGRKHLNQTSPLSLLLSLSPALMLIVSPSCVPGHSNRQVVLLKALYLPDLKAMLRHGPDTQDSYLYCLSTRLVLYVSLGSFKSATTSRALSRYTINLSLTRSLSLFSLSLCESL